LKNNHSDKISDRRFFREEIIHPLKAMLSLLTDKVTDAECSKKCRSPKDATKIINVVTKASGTA